MNRSVAAAVVATVLTTPAWAGEMATRIETVPPGAKVEEAGRVLGKTPISLTYPTGYFRPRGTVWGAFLGAPLEFTFTLDGYEPKTVKLGRGPFPWRNLYGQILYQHYLLDQSYRIQLTPKDQASSTTPAVDEVAQLERLAALHEKGALTDEEFKAAKARVLAGTISPAGAVAPVAPEHGASGKTPNYLDDHDPAALCSRLITGSINGWELAKPTSPTKQESTAEDGSDREVTIGCAWQLLSPPATLHIDVTCGEKTPETLCTAAGQPTAQGLLSCVWGTVEIGHSVVAGCSLTAAVVADPRRHLPPDAINPISLDMREVLRLASAHL